VYESRRPDSGVHRATTGSPAPQWPKAGNELRGAQLSPSLPGWILAHTAGSWAYRTPIGGDGDECAPFGDPHSLGSQRALGFIYGLFEQHGDSHGPNAAWYWRNCSCIATRFVVVDVAYVAVVVAGVDDCAAGLESFTFTNRGRRTAATTMSASFTIAGRSKVWEWQTVTVALRARSSMPTGLPKIGLRPMITACRTPRETLCSSVERAVILRLDRGRPPPGRRRSSHASRKAADGNAS
jgi:hypothetical protein